MTPHLIKLHLTTFFISLLLLPCAMTQADSIIPPTSALGQTDASWQRLLLSPLTDETGIGKGAWKMKNLTVTPAPTLVAPKLGQNAVLLRGEAEDAGAKGDFSIAGAVPGQAHLLGLWVYLAPDANVDKVGLQLQDGEGESLLATVPATWQGWQWVEFDLQGTAIAQAYPQPDKNKKVDTPVASVHVAWFAKAAGPSFLAINALVAATEMGAAATPFDVTLTGRDWGETNTPLVAPQLVLSNFEAQPRAATIEYSIQRDASLFSDAPPDPIYGTDHALGAKSWTEVNGKVWEEGSLTDGKDWTAARLPWGEWTESYQFVDLGQARSISHLSYLSGDANWVWTADISASLDGKEYQPVPELQGVDMHGKWGLNQIAVTTPFRARFLRLHYAKNGEKVNALGMPSALSVYDGTADETWSIPVVGETLAKGTLTQQIAPRSFGAVTLNDKTLAGKPLAPGAYFIAARVKAGEQTQLLYHHFFIMPAPLPSVADSRFGLNTADISLAPLNRRLGIGWVRFENMKWPMISPAPGEYRFDGSVGPWFVPHDAIIDAYRAQGINFLPFLFQTPDYATSAPATVDKNRWSSYPPKDNAAMGDFVFQTVARYGSQKHPASELKTPDKQSGLNKIKVYEIWNEPNLTDPGWGPWVGTTAQYNEMLRAASEAAKRADPAALVTNGGFAGIDIDTVDTLLTPYADGKKPLDFVDVLNVHFYSGRIAPEIATNDPNANRGTETQNTRTYEDDLHRLIAWRDKNKPGMPIWMTETGYDSAGEFGTNERIQAARLPRVVMMTLAAGIDKVLIYRESGSTASMHAASGLVRNDGSLKPSWFTVATMIRQLDGAAKGARRLPYPNPNVRLYAWTKGTETILSAWTIEGNETLNLNLGNATITDAFGHTRQENVASKLPLSIYPTYIRKIANPAPIKALATQAQREEIARGQEQVRQAKLRAYLFDFGSIDKVGSLEIGTNRAFTPVLADQTWDEAKGYGFSPHAALQNNTQSWVKDPLETDSCRLDPQTSFRFRVAPGRYQFKLRADPLGAPIHITLSGSANGDKTFTTSDNMVLSADIEAGAAPLVLQADSYMELRWVTLVEEPKATAR